MAHPTTRLQVNLHHPLQVNLIMPSMVCGLIIGKQGQTIKALQDLSAADIK